MSKQYNFTIEQGTTVRKQFAWKDSNGALYDLTDCTARMQVRSRIEDTAVLLELTTENGGITLGGSTWSVMLTITATATSAFAWRHGVYDIEVTMENGDVVRFLEGKITVSGEVTR